MKGVTKDLIWRTLFCVLMVPSVLVTTPLWVWAHYFILDHPVESPARQVQIGLGCVVSVMTFAVPMALCVLMSWGLTTLLYRRFVERG